MLKRIKIHAYDPEWPVIYLKQSEDIKNCLKNNFIEIHHIGSTSIPGMIAKEDVDILCIVENLEESKKLSEIGYIFKGEYNIPLKYSYSKNTDEYKVNLHIVEKNHGFISLNLKFRDYLRENKSAKEEYAKLKNKLLDNPKASLKRGMFTEYNLGKNLFIKDILEKSGFDELIVNLASHDREWDEYHRIRKKEIFDGADFEYNPNHPTITAEGHYHFVLYKGVEIVGVSHIELIDENISILRPFAIDAAHQRKGYGSYLLKIMEKWVKQKGRSILKMHADNEAVPFYKKHGYEEMEFDEESLFEDCTDLGKLL